MIGKMIQNLENKNGVTDKKPGDKDREDARNVSQGPRRNKKELAYNELCSTLDENTLEGTNSRITEAEDRISEIEDRMVEINETEREKEKKKELKEMRTTSEASGTMLNAPTFES